MARVPRLLRLVFLRSTRDISGEPAAPGSRADRRRLVRRGEPPSGVRLAAARPGAPAPAADPLRPRVRRPPAPGDRSGALAAQQRLRDPLEPVGDGGDVEAAFGVAAGGNAGAGAGALVG